MAFEAVVFVTIQKVTDILIQESIIFDTIIDQLEDIRLELRLMQGYLTDAVERQGDDEEAKEWVGEYLVTLYKVEDMIESYVLIESKKKKICLFQSYGFYFHDLTARQKLRRKMKQIEKEIKILNHKKPNNIEDASLRGSSIGKRQRQLVLDSNIPKQKSAFLVDKSRTRRMPSGSYEEDDSDLVGFRMNEISLEIELSSKHGKIIRVVGPSGSGKTTLVKLIYNRKSIKKQFECHAWLDVSEENVLEDLLLKTWKQFNKEDTKHTIPDKDKLDAFLQGKKYLVVLDDVRNESSNAWEELIHALPDINGCKVVLITRENDKAELGKGDGQPLHLKNLSDDDSWELFLKSSRLEKDSSVISGHTSLRDQILKECRGIPLNIVLLGGLLSTKKMIPEEWSRLISQVSDSMDILCLSYADLPAHCKLCLLYLTLFPKEFDFSVRRILRLWLAEGFLQRPLGSTEDLAEECFYNLVRRNLVKISKFRSDGGPKKCRLPGFLRECLSPKAQEISLFHVHHTSTDQRQQQSPCKNSTNTSAEQIIFLKPGVRRIVEYADIKDYDCDNNYQNLRSYLSFNFQRYDTPAKGVGNFLRRIIGNKGFGLLRVLDLEGVYKPILPTTLKHLFQLRYLGLRSTFLDSLPQSVGDLPYLETLDLKRTYINTLPSSVWKLKHLRYLNLPQIRLNKRIQQPSSKLQTLWGLIIDDECNMDGLRQLVDLRELGITCQLKQSNDLLKSIISLTHLQSLSLTSKDGKGRPSILNFEPMSDLRKLYHLKLLGELSQGSETPNKGPFQFPPNLRVLTLSLSKLEKDPMEILSMLESLSVLRLLAKSYLGQKMHCQKKGFHNLRVLKLWMLDELEEWVVEQGGMPKIRELNIRYCQKLKELPKLLLQQTTLKELILTNMPKEFEENVRKDISEHTNLQSNRYDVTLLPWDKEPKLWE